MESSKSSIVSLWFRKRRSHHANITWSNAECKPVISGAHVVRPRASLAVGAGPRPANQDHHATPCEGGRAGRYVQDRRNRDGRATTEGLRGHHLCARRRPMVGTAL